MCQPRPLHLRVKPRRGQASGAYSDGVRPLALGGDTEGIGWPHLGQCEPVTQSIG